MVRTKEKIFIIKKIKNILKKLKLFFKKVLTLEILCGIILHAAEYFSNKVFEN